MADDEAAAAEAPAVEPPAEEPAAEAPAEAPPSPPAEEPEAAAEPAAEPAAAPPPFQRQPSTAEEEKAAEKIEAVVRGKEARQRVDTAVECSSSSRDYQLLFGFTAPLILLYQSVPMLYWYFLHANKGRLDPPMQVKRNASVNWPADRPTTNPTYRQTYRMLPKRMPRKRTVGGPRIGTWPIFGSFSPILGAAITTTR